MRSSIKCWRNVKILNEFYTEIESQVAKFLLCFLKIVDFRKK